MTIALWLTAPVCASAGDLAYRLAIPQSSATNLIAYWDFNAPGHPSNMTVIAGAWQPVTNAGPDSSPCMETVSNTTLVAIDFPSHALPLEVTYSHAARFQQAPGTIGTAITWENDQGAALISGLTRHEIKRPGNESLFSRWYSSRALLTEKWVVIWDWQDTTNPGNIILLARPPNGRLVWGIFGFQRVDNFAVHRALSNNVPPILVQCLEAVDKLPAGKRTGVFTLPGVQSPGGGPVRIQFLPQGLSGVR